jgi:hypothetical protein
MQDDEINMRIRASGWPSITRPRAVSILRVERQRGLTL